MSKLSELINKTNHTLPKQFPSLTDWVIYWFGDPATQSPPLPMQLKVTSGIPEHGQISGIAFFDPGTQLQDGNGNAIEVPALLPVAYIPYSPQGEKGTWMHIREFQRLIKRQMRVIEQQETQEVAAK